MVELPSLLVTIFSLLVNNSFAFVIAPPWADDNTNPCSEVRKHPPPPKVLREGVKKRIFYGQADRRGGGEGSVFVLLTTKSESKTQLLLDA